jgi:peroxiredoxin-like protein
MSGFEPRKYFYKTRTKWKGDEKGEISSEEKTSIKIALPKELGGPGVVWSPDELFVSSVDSCAMLTFFWLIENRNIKVISYESSAEGVSQIDSDGVFRFTKVLLKPTIVISDAKDKSIVEEALKKLDNWCCISNSVKTKVVIEPTIIIGTKE